ncbi:ABATE domain-containing protein [Mycobacterium lepromatosis]|uniref:ABATE domain-containing protein n=1 Tax=Mycobacterium lepromatosis TaxID=480418 RepID=UPI0005F76656|nr:ABATE domain-containing protein [Mycobacterium lepromatosis]
MGRHTDGVHDDLTTPAALRDWLATVDHQYAAEVRGDPCGADLAEVKLLRDSLRRLAACAIVDLRPAAQSLRSTALTTPLQQ